MIEFNFPIYHKKQKHYLDYSLTEVTSYTNIQKMIREFPGVPEDDIRIICNKVATRLAAL